MSPLFISQRKVMSVEKRVRELAEEKLADRPDLFIVAVKVVNNKKVILLLDGDNGVGIDDCAMVSRHVGYHLEEENLINNAYNLEVSSPGLDTPLMLDRQFVKNVGRNLNIKKQDGSRIEGKLLEVKEDALLISHQVKEKGKKAQQVESLIEKNNIAEAKVSISF